MSDQGAFWLRIAVAACAGVIAVLLLLLARDMHRLARAGSKMIENLQLVQRVAESTVGAPTTKLFDASEMTATEKHRQLEFSTPDPVLGREEDLWRDACEYFEPGRKRIELAAAESSFRSGFVCGVRACRLKLAHGPTPGVANRGSA
jgi:hypothetical protein